LDDIIERCQKEIESQTYVIEQQADIALARLALGRARFFKAVAQLMDNRLDPPELQKTVQDLAELANAEKTEPYKRIAAFAKAYFDSEFELPD
jgi:hypothetical protein